MNKSMPMFRGEYSASTTYVEDDVVFFNGSTYWHYSTAPTTSVAPTNTQTWRLILSAAAAEPFIRRAEEAALRAEQEVATIYTLEIAPPMKALDEAIILTTPTLAQI